MYEFFIPLNGNLTLGQINQNNIIRPIDKFRMESEPKKQDPLGGEGSYGFILQ